MISSKITTKKVSPNNWNVSCSDCFLSGREGVAPIRALGEACTVAPASFLGAAPYLHLQWYLGCWLVSMKLELVLCNQEKVFLMAGVLAFLKMTRFTCCLVKSMVGTPRRDGRKEALLFLSKWEVRRPGRTTVASPKGPGKCVRASHLGDHWGCHRLWPL